MSATTHELTFYVWDDRVYDFLTYPLSRVRCIECDTEGDAMELRQMDVVRDAWMLECECGEQYFTHND